MSYKYSTTTNKNPKVYFKQYLDNINEPLDEGINATPPELMAELLEDSYSMRRRFRLLAKKIRNLG
jgi:hypothetical protein